MQWALSRLDYTVVQYGSVGLGGDDAARAWAAAAPRRRARPGRHGPRDGIALLKRSGARAVITLGPAPVDGAHALLMDHREVGRVAGSTS